MRHVRSVLVLAVLTLGTTAGQALGPWPDPYDLHQLAFLGPWPDPYGLQDVDPPPTRPRRLPASELN